MKKPGIFILTSFIVLITGFNVSGQTIKKPINIKGAENIIVFGEKDWFAGWPANNGVWTWDGGKEILVGFSYGRFVEQEGHNIEGRSDATPNVKSYLARSTDGGKTWTKEDPENFVGDGLEPVASPGQINFEVPGFAMRVMGIGYHGSLDPKGAFFVSENKGKTWSGPYRFNGLLEDENLQGKVITARTSYLVTGPASCLVFMSARPGTSIPGQIAVDKSFVSETTDGGKTFRFKSWIVPLSDLYRAVMPSVVRMNDESIVAALRRRIMSKDSCWIDSYISYDNGASWKFLSKVGETGDRNGNPPALAKMKDNSLVCVYGDRKRVKMFYRISTDNGKTWGTETVLRDNFNADSFGDNDFGYPRLAVNNKNKLVAIYYWSTAKLPENHIECTIWKPKE